jgi:serine/threonine protein kinase
MDAEREDLVLLREGPVTTVLAGVDKETGEAFALKVYPGPIDQHTRSRLHKELDAAGASATALVPDQIGELPDGRLSLRMELCAQSLAELVDANGPLSITDALATGEILSATLAAAHQAGLVHGGVTPANVLFRASGALVLADFGVALRRAFPRDPAAGTGFLAPETIHDGTADERTDLYGLGAILYLALSGTPPHQGRSAAPITRPGLPPGLTRLVFSLLETDPDARPIDAALVASRLGAMIEQAVTPSPPPAAAEPDQDQARPRRRTPAALKLIGAVAMAVALIVVTGLALRNRAPEVAAPVTPAASSSPPEAVRIELADPADHGDYVELTWQSTKPLQFAVIVAPEGREQQVVYVQRATTYRLDVEPVRRYCFLVQGTDQQLTYESQAKGIRRAACTR